MAPLFLLPLAVATAAAIPIPITLHPRNPHYFLFRGKPTVLITSAGHYGQVLNLDFDYVKSLDAQRRDGLNYARIFTGVYCEDPKSLNIQHNILAPLTGRLICPFARSETPGYASGGNKFDLTKWDDAYFRRLKDFCEQASRRGIVVEVSLFCPFYGDEMWNLSPMNAANNVNGIGKAKREEVYTLQHEDLTKLQDSVTRKIVQELAGFDNVFYEICNEPYFGGVTIEWQRHIADVISAEEASFSHKHLIAQNIANQSATVKDPHPAVSILNFHYAAPPTAVPDNYGLNRVIGFDETGFKGVKDSPYRTEGWDFIMAGGGLYDNLDYSFTALKPNGTEEVKEPTPGGGGPTLRAQLAALKRFIERFDFVNMHPVEGLVKGGVPDGATVRVLGDDERHYALYLKGGTQADLKLAVRAGVYRAEWVNPRTGKVDRAEDIEHPSGDLTLATPKYEEDIALSLVRR